MKYIQKKKHPKRKKNVENTGGGGNIWAPVCEECKKEGRSKEGKER